MSTVKFSRYWTFKKQSVTGHMIVLITEQRGGEKEKREKNSRINHGQMSHADK